jgi:hypothetical protein
MQIDIKPE